MRESDHRLRRRNEKRPETRRRPHHLITATPRAPFARWCQQGHQPGRASIGRRPRGAVVVETSLRGTSAGALTSSTGAGTCDSSAGLLPKDLSVHRRHCPQGQGGYTPHHGSAQPRGPTQSHLFGRWSDPQEGQTPGSSPSPAPFVGAPRLPRRSASRCHRKRRTTLAS